MPPEPPEPSEPTQLPDQPEALTCPNGHPVQPGVRFCPECGAAVGEAAATPQPAQRNLIPWAIGGAAVLFLIVVGVVFLGGGGHKVEGTFALFDPEVGSDCHGSGGYDDIRPGAAVTIRNESGNTIASGDLEEGEHFEGTGCEYPFTIDDVPNAEFYRIQVSHRGEVEFSHAEMEDNDWTVSLSLGDEGS
jgi:hypothetical protein